MNKEVAMLACLTVSLSALTATTVVDSPARAIVSYASESKGVVNARAYKHGTWNATCDARSSAGGTWTDESIGFRLTLELGD